MPVVLPVQMHYSSYNLWFDPGDIRTEPGDYVIVETERGTEFGMVAADVLEVSEEEIEHELKPVIRLATEEDVELAAKLARQGEEAMGIYRKLVKNSGLDIKPVAVEYLFGKERIVFYFAAEDRVDFRDLVRDLAATFHQRIDMHQIGVRDEARLSGGYGTCGQELCCVRFKGQFQPVSIRMAKEQDLPLNASKISGVCGRLMCCLRYEFEAYRDFKQRAPKKNALIDTPLGKAKVVEYNTPQETLTLRLDNAKTFTIALKDMTCSDACIKQHAGEVDNPLRPDTVSKEALEALGISGIVTQLASMDQEEQASLEKRVVFTETVQASFEGQPSRDETPSKNTAPRQKTTRTRKVTKPLEKVEGSTSQENPPAAANKRSRKSADNRNISQERPTAKAKRTENAAAPKPMPQKRTRHHRSTETPEVKAPQETPARNTPAPSLPVRRRRRPGDHGGNA